LHIRPVRPHPVRRCPTTHPPWGGRLTTYPASALRVADLTTHHPAGDTSHSDLRSPGGKRTRPSLRVECSEWFCSSLHSTHFLIPYDPGRRRRNFHSYGCTPPSPLTHTPSTVTPQPPSIHAGRRAPDLHPPQAHRSCGKHLQGGTCTPLQLTAVSQMP